MNLFNQLFQNKIGQSEKWQMVDHLGLNGEPLVVEERIQERVLRVFELKEGFVQSFPVSLSKLNTMKTDVLLKHQDLFPLSKTEKKAGIAEEILPSQWASLVTKVIPPTSELHFISSGTEEELQKIWDGFVQVEKSMSHYELAFWLLEPLQLTLVFHFVRRNLHQSGLVSLAFFEEIQKKLGPISYRAVRVSKASTKGSSGFSDCFQQLQRVKEAFEMKL